jgi:hypothetical protein
MRPARPHICLKVLTLSILLGILELIALVGGAGALYPVVLGERMITRCAGRFTPAASVDVAHNTRSVPDRNADSIACIEKDADVIARFNVRTTFLVH